MPRGGQRPNAGRKRGSLNRRSIGLAERMVGVGTTSSPSPVPQQPQSNPLARDILEDFMLRYADMALYHQPRPADQSPNPYADEEKFFRYSRFVLRFASALAPYQSPTLRTIVVAPPPTNDSGEASKFFEDRSKPIDPIEATRMYRRLMDGEL